MRKALVRSADGRYLAGYWDNDAFGKIPTWTQFSDLAHQFVNADVATKFAQTIDVDDFTIEEVGGQHD